MGNKKIKISNLSMNNFPLKADYASLLKVWRLYNPAFKYEDMYDDLGGPWAGHKYFGYDLVRNLKPKNIVELGTHLGCSLFSLAQAAHDGKVKTRLDAIDSWLGDKHSSIYGENIFLRVQEIKKACYPRMHINLIRKTFDQAVKDYPDNSIDLLHIDGLHTFKAVKHDYDTWFPKVKKDGIILLHDTAVKKWGFGIYKVFDNIKKDFKVIEFTHSYGLGVIFKDPRAFAKLEKFIPSLKSYYSSKAEKAQSEWESARQSQLLTEYKKQLEEYRNQLERIKSSKTYKIWQFYNRFFKRNILKSK